MRRALLAAVAALAATAWSCGPPPDPNVTAVVGDSLTMTTLLAGQLPADWDIHSMLGWEAEDAQQGVEQRVADGARNPARVAIALCNNDASQHTGQGPEYGDGFTATDAEQLGRLRSALHPATRVTWVLPDYMGSDPLYAAGINACRSWVTAEAARRGDCVTDWRARNTPADIGPDGIHLTAAGHANYGAMIEQAVNSCG
jgi:lysophospholipase L1-like esterase